MMTFECLHLYPSEGEVVGPIAASLPFLSDPVEPFQGDTLASRVQATSPHSVMQNQDGVPPQQQPDDPPWGTTLLGTDQRRTVLHKRAAQDQADWVYTPYGHNRDTRGVTGGLGFNGERRESVTGHYLLGAGYRAYNPVLMRFHSPDSLSPFDAGGWNPYAYCVGDPVNFVDPTGHLPSWANVVLGIVGGIALGVVSGGVGAVVAGSMAASSAATLGTASMVLGTGLEIGAFGTGVAAAVVGGKQGTLLGKVSIGLGLAGAVVGGFGFGMRVRSFRMKAQETENIRAYKEIMADRVRPPTPDPDFDPVLASFYKKLPPEEVDALKNDRYSQAGIMTAVNRGRRGGVDHGPLRDISPAPQQSENAGTDPIRRIRRNTWGPN